MKNPVCLVALIVVSMLSACSGGSKKVLIMSSGKVTIAGNAITAQSGTTHTETPLIPDGDSITVVLPSGAVGFSVKEPGLYILNLKKDTLVGSYQRTGTDNSQQVISQESLHGRIDSLYLLMSGTNVNEAAKNYHIVPLQLTRITANTDAQIIGPYLKVPGSFDPSREHEVYKFFTNKEMAEIIEKLKPMADPTPR
ncbi:MAG: hypothetical protein ABI687_06600 [Flavitalea sp.]